ncbi:hypothetical protein [Photorhabdus khanii]|uniref:Calcium-mediated lectin domain-containing protein n=2 Tax=Photorhabdus khanii TaxID=1004150 RepID=A0A4R4JNG3_9GAMM|nr:hypothetical protein [Photorhabdus khanii]ETS31369.1 hypothetical protein PTE_02524 [Photorhabdus khanii NC19]OHV50947.1 hypothetical protein BB987_18015 [Photorhabdus temperata]TDB55863.1 hypothetical protein C5467_13165 [Photorhabdus khanii subsp. guanajuatensis]
MASVILYGDKIHIKNNYNNGNGGYLDTNGHANVSGAKYNVLTASSPTRGPGTGTWQILSASGKNIGTEVYSGDTVFLVNLYQNNGGYLGTNGYAPSPELYNVYTADKTARPVETLTWYIFSDTTNGYDGKVREGDIIRFLNSYNSVRGGFLDTCFNATAPGAVYNVYTSRLSNRGNGTGTWNLSKVI